VRSAPRRPGLIHHAGDAPVGDEPQERHEDIDAAGDLRLEEGGPYGDGVEDRREFAL
jgi:hypothetical protein